MYATVLRHGTSFGHTDAGRLRYLVFVALAFLSFLCMSGFSADPVHPHAGGFRAGGDMREHVPGCLFSQGQQPSSACEVSPRSRLSCLPSSACLSYSPVSLFPCCLDVHIAFVPWVPTLLRGADRLPPSLYPPHNFVLQLAFPRVLRLLAVDFSVATT